MRLMSFALTTEQFRNRTKTVTRRRGWLFLKPGDELMGVVKGMGLKKGEHPERLGPIRVVSVRRERLDEITPEDVAAEGYPGMSPREFVAHYLKNMGGLATQEVTRIEFAYID